MTKVSLSLPVDSETRIDSERRSRPGSIVFGSVVGGVEMVKG